MTIEHGVDIQSPKYGVVKGFKPHRSEWNHSGWVKKGPNTQILIVCSSVAEAATTDNPYTHVIVTTKSLPEVLPTSELVAPLLTSPYSIQFPQPTYVLVQNGLGVERDLYRALKEISATGEEEPKLVTCSLYLMMRQVAKNAVKHSDLVSLI